VFDYYKQKMEVIDIGLSDLEPISLKLDDIPSSSPASVNFGPGIELLMNDKQKSSSSSTSVNLDDIEKLAEELNELSDKSTAAPSPAPESTRSFNLGNLFNFGSSSKSAATTEATKDSSSETTDSKVGNATGESFESAKTWDGFSKIGEIPANKINEPRMTERDRRRKKRAMLKKLEDWYQKGHIKSNSHFTMDSPYEEIEDEYEAYMEEKRKKDSVKLQGWWFMTLINSIEYGNAVFDPFGLNLDGWGEQVSEDIDSYEEIFSELHEKYKGGKLAPELSLLLRLGFSAAMVNITNKALSTATPGFNDVIRQSPELMKMFTNATVQSMSQQSPGFGFVNSMMNPEPQVNTMFGAPPPPVETKNQTAPVRPGMNFTNAASSRPDISMGRGAMFKESGVDISAPFERVNSTPSTMFQPNLPPASSNAPRPEMRGPQSVDVDSLLSGLKRRDTPINELSSSTQQYNMQSTNISLVDENDSMVSVISLGNNSQNPQLPKRSNRRKNRSDKNVISLDI